MVFDPKLHDIDPTTGFAVHKDGGGVVGLHSAPAAAKSSEHEEFPKWVEAHESHVVGDIAPEWPESFRPRGKDAKVQVLVNDADEAARAMGEKPAEVKPAQDHVEMPGVETGESEEPLSMSQRFDERPRAK